MREAGWSGMMSLPRVMQLDPDGTLRLQVLPQTSELRAGLVAPAQDGTILRQASGEILCGGAKGSALQFVMSDGMTELLRADYSPTKHAFTIDGKEIALQPNDEPSLHAFVDGSVIELIVSERIGCTKRFYYTAGHAPDVAVHATGAVRLTAWKIAPISPNRLTTPARNA